MILTQEVILNTNNIPNKYLSEEGYSSIDEIRMDELASEVFLLQRERESLNQKLAEVEQCYFTVCRMYQEQKKLRGAA